jgi:hypothetical protein
MKFSGPVQLLASNFWAHLLNLRCYQCIGFSFDSGYAARGENYEEKCFVKLTPVANVTKLFSVVSYNFS